jgi:hypothetical protein
MEVNIITTKGTITKDNNGVIIVDFLGYEKREKFTLTFDKKIKSVHLTCGCQESNKSSDSMSVTLSVDKKESFKKSISVVFEEDLKFLQKIILRNTAKQ